jgi:hypothetical protein
VQDILKLNEIRLEVKAIGIEKIEELNEEVVKKRERI